MNKCLVAKNLLTNVTKTNEHLNVTTFVRALIYCTGYRLTTHVYDSISHELKYSNCAQLCITPDSKFIYYSRPSGYPYILLSLDI